MMRRGFTFVELLALLAIVAVGLALGLPAVYQSIAEARTLRCRNNLKQIGLALHNYHDTFTTFPPGWVSREGTTGLGARLGWQTMILPYVDQAALYNQIDFTPMSFGVQEDQRKLFQTAIEIYRCPSDRAPKTNPLRGGYAASNFSGSYGHVPTPRLRPLGLGDNWPGAVVAPMEPRAPSRRVGPPTKPSNGAVIWPSGVFARNSSIRMRDIVDGTSNTMLAGERSFTSGAGIWAGVTDNFHEDDAVTDCSHRSQINFGWFGFSSLHAGGANVLMVDGSARFLADKTDSKPGKELGLLQRLASRNDGLPVDSK